MGEQHVDHDPNHPLTKALRELVQAHKVAGAVLLTISLNDEGEPCLGVNSSGREPYTGAIMTRLADEIMIHFAAGLFDTVMQQPN